MKENSFQLNPYRVTPFAKRDQKYSILNSFREIGRDQKSFSNIYTDITSFSEVRTFVVTIFD